MAVVAAMAMVGCFWREFEARVTMHAELLRDEAEKGVDVAVAGLFTAEGLTELLYPLGRGRAFAAEARRRLGERPAPQSLVDFEGLLAAYTHLCDVIDQARRAHAGPVPTEVLRGPLGAVRARAAAVLGEAAVPEQP